MQNKTIFYTIIFICIIILLFLLLVFITFILSQKGSYKNLYSYISLIIIKKN